MIRTAIIGYGFSSTTFHIPFITADPNYQLTHIVSGKGPAVQLDFPDVTVVSQWQSLDCSQVDLVIITTPNHLHYEQSRFYLEQGCHVVCEKPFVLSSEQAQELQNIARDRQRVLTVFQNRRWDGDFLTLESILDHKKVGTPKRLVSRFDRFRPSVRQRWREQAGPGAGILWDLGPHLLDQTVALFGVPQSIQATVQAMRTDAQVDDNFDIWLSYPDLQVVLGSSAFQAGPNQRFQLEGTEGTYIKHGLDVQEDALRKGYDVNDERWGQEPEESWGLLYQASGSHLVTTKPGNYAVFWHQLAQSILEGAQPPVPLEDSILVIRLLELAIESSQKGARLSVESA